jgi:hypothetical protein
MIAAFEMTGYAAAVYIPGTVTLGPYHILLPRRAACCMENAWAFEASFSVAEASPLFRSFVFLYIRHTALTFFLPYMTLPCLYLAP